jgi:hypothetical protein
MTDLAQGHHGKAPGGLFLSICESVYRFFERPLYAASIERPAEKLEQHLEALLRAAIGRFRSRLVALVSG